MLPRFVDAAQNKISSQKIRKGKLKLHFRTASKSSGHWLGLRLSLNSCEETPMASALIKNCTGKLKNIGRKPCNKEKNDAAGTRIKYLPFNRRQMGSRSDPQNQSKSRSNKARHTDLVHHKTKDKSKDPKWKRSEAEMMA